MRFLSSLFTLSASMAVVGACHAMLPTPISTTPPPMVGSSTPIISILPTTPASPAPLVQQELTGRIFAYLVQSQDGQETLTPITPAMPVASGSIVEYQGFFDNVSNQRIRSATLGLEIPVGLELISVAGDNVLASIDNQRYTRMPLRTLVDGQISDIPLSYYRGLRWQVADIGLAGTVMVKYRAKVL